MEVNFLFSKITELDCSRVGYAVGKRVFKTGFILPTVSYMRIKLAYTVSHHIILYWINRKWSITFRRKTL